MKRPPWLRRPLLPLLLALLIGLAGASPAAACSCAVRSVAEQAADATLIAGVTVLRIERPTNPAGPTSVVYVVTPTTLWKGSPSGEYRVASAGDGAACGLEGIKEGDFVILFAGTADAATAARLDARYEASLCGGTAPSSKELLAEIERVVGPGRVLSPPISVRTPTTPAPTEAPSAASPPATALPSGLPAQLRVPGWGAGPPLIAVVLLAAAVFAGVLVVRVRRRP